MTAWGSTCCAQLFGKSRGPVLAAAALLLGPGCQEATKVKLDALATEYQQSLDRLRTEDTERRKLEEGKLKVETVRAERLEKLRNAQERIASGDAKGALAILDELLRPPPEPPKNPGTAVKPADAKGAPARQGDKVADAAGEKAPGDAKDPKAPAEATDANSVKPAADQPVPLDPKDQVQMLVAKGVALSMLERKAEAIEVYAKALELDPGNRVARRNLGKIHFNDRDYKKALEAWASELADGWRDADLLYSVGVARQEIGMAEGRAHELASARLALQQVLIERPGDLDVLRRISNIEYETGNYTEAARDLNLARRQAPLEPDDVEKLGNCYLALGDKMQAADYLELAATMKPLPAETYAALAEIHESLHLSTQAGEWLSRAYKGVPAEASASERYRVGSLLMDGGHEEDAAAWLAAVGSTDASYADAQARLVRIHSAAGREDEALIAYENCRKSAVKDGAAHVAVGAIQLRNRQLEKAAEAFALASSLESSRVDGLLGLAEVYYARGNLEGALLQYQKALGLRPGDSKLGAAAQQVASELQLRGSGQPTVDSPTARPTPE